MKKIKLDRLLIILLFTFCCVLLKMFSISFSSERSFYKKTINVKGLRGNIKDSQGRLLATSIISYDLYFYSAKIEKKVFYNFLKDFLNFLKINHWNQDISKNKIVNYYLKKRSLLIKKGIISIDKVNSFIDEMAKKYPKTDIKGAFYFEKRYQRFYTFPYMYGPLLGFINKNQNAICGIEKAKDNVLSGQDGKYYDNGLKIHGGIWGKINWLKEPQAGNDIQLTINTIFQHFVYHYLKEGVKKYKAKRGVAILIKTNSGKIIAWANYPSFNPNIYYKYSDYSVFKNMGYENIYEPGSIIKPLIIGFMLDKKYNNPPILTPKNIFYCENGRYVLKNGRKYRIIRDVEKNKYLSVEKILVHSSNIGMSKIMAKFYQNGNLRNLYIFLLSTLNLKRNIGINFPNYPRGMLLNYKHWNEIFSLSSIGMGYEISAPLLNFLYAFNSIPSNGNLYKPILYQNEKPVAIEKNVFSPYVINFLKKALRDVVLEGTGKNVNSQYIDIAGKTGTAKKYDRKLKKYSNKKYLASFIGYFPADNPEYTLGVFIDEPQKHYYGGIVAGSIFKKIAERIYFYEFNKQNIAWSKNE